MERDTVDKYLSEWNKVCKKKLGSLLKMAVFANHFGTTCKQLCHFLQPKWQKVQNTTASRYIFSANDSQLGCEPQGVVDPSLWTEITLGLNRKSFDARLWKFLKNGTSVWGFLWVFPQKPGPFHPVGCVPFFARRWEPAWSCPATDWTPTPCGSSSDL